MWFTSTRRLDIDLGLVGDDDEAMGVFVEARNAGRPFTAVILDITIPGRRGAVEVLAALRGLDASIPAIVTSSYSEGGVARFEDFGFGVALGKLPGLAEEVRRRGIAVAVCPVSNQLLGYVPDLRNHPALALLNAGVPITLSSDDPALFQYQGVTHDYWMATMAWNLDLADLKQLAMASLLHAAVPDDQRQEMLAAWRRQWSRFVARQLPGAAPSGVQGQQP